jgi:hypothetical protein
MKERQPDAAPLIKPPPAATDSSSNPSRRRTLSASMLSTSSQDSPHQTTTTNKRKSLRNSSVSPRKKGRHSPTAASNGKASTNAVDADALLNDDNHHTFVSANNSDEFSVAALRAIVANHLTQDTFETYQCYYEAGVHGYHFMRDMHHLDDLKQRVRLTRAMAAQQHIPLQHMVWADAFAIQTISNYFQTGFLIVNESGGQAGVVSGSVVRPDFNTRAGRERSRRHWVMLHLSRREHYSLLSVDGWSFFISDIHPLPVFLADRFQIDLHTDVRQS